MMADADQRILASVVAVLDRRAPQLPRAVLRIVARDCLAIARAMVEADSQSGERPPPDLARRILKALSGYLRDESR